MKSNLAVVYNNKSQSKEYMEIVNFIVNSYRDEKIKTELIKITELENLYRIGNLKNLPTKIFFWDKNWDLAQNLKKEGFQIHENPLNAKICENKVSSLKILKRKRKILPKTKILKIKKIKRDIDNEKINHFPIVLKYENSENGSGVRIIYNKQEMRYEIKDKSQNEKVILQEYLNFNPNLLIKLFIIKNECIAGMKVEYKKDGPVNYTVYVPNETEKKIAIKSCKIMGLNIAGVDIIYKEKNRPVICELNTQPNLLRIYNVTGINVVERFIEKQNYGGIARDSKQLC